MKAYKGFDKNLQCRGFQYEIGKEYELPEGKHPKACKIGFHACEYPLDVLKYYNPAESRFCEVEQDGELSRDSEDTKVASSKIKIGAELSIANLVHAAIEYTKEHRNQEVNASEVDCGVASSTGYCGVASSTGKHSVAMSCGVDGRAKAKLGCAIFLVERKRNKISGEYEIASVGSAIVDGFKIKEDTWYTLKNGEFVEVE